MKNYLASSIAAATVFALSSVPAMAYPVTTINASITQAEVETAQTAWGKALVAISEQYRKNGIESARAKAKDVLASAYGYNMGAVLFKPTLTQAPQTFRTTVEGALAYFVGHDEAYPQDTGFALMEWTGVEIDNAAMFISGDTALTMGNVRITDTKGNVTTVDKSWAFQRGEDGALRIVLHHSSLPYAPK